MEPQMDEALLYVGTYTDNTASKGIYLLHMDRRTGQLRQVSSVDAGANPSFLAIHPGGTALYAVNEVATHNGRSTGAVTAFAIARGSGELTRRNEQDSGGAGPCFVSVDPAGHAVLVANYDSGTVALLPIAPDVSLNAATSIVKHEGRGPNAERQEAPHAHCIIAHPSNRFALAADLGADRVFVYSLEGGSLRHVEGGDAVMRAGSGPRHIALHPTKPLVFVANELDSTVASLRFDPARGMLSVIGVVPTLPSPGAATNYPADIHVAPGGRSLYVSNRGHNSITVFAIEDSGSLTTEQVIPTGGDWPRNFALDNTGRWLLVANQRSNSIVVFRRDEKTGRLQPTSHRIELPSPVCVKFLPAG